MLQKTTILSFFTILLLYGIPLEAQILYYDISTRTTENVGGNSYSDGDVFRYHTDDGFNEVIFDEGSFASGNDIEAFTILDNGNVVFSAETSGSIFGVSFNDEDLVEVNLDTNTASLYFDGSAAFAGDMDIDAVHIRDNGNILFSTVSTFTPDGLSGPSYKDGDILEYDVVSETISVYLSESIFATDADVDAIHELSNGNILLSTESSETINGTDYSISFSDGSIVEYSMATGNAWVHTDETIFADNADIDALYAAQATMLTPEPSQYLTLGGFLLLVAIARRRRRNLAKL